MSLYRILALIIIFIAILVLPYWIYLPLLFIAIILFPFFWEGILFALLIQVLFGAEVGFFLFLFSPVVLATLVLLIVIIPIRGRLRIYD